MVTLQQVEEVNEQKERPKPLEVVDDWGEDLT